jgi:S-disulfanyl-L-cysteine oxidoreductase SoxD
VSGHSLAGVMRYLVFLMAVAAPVLAQTTGAAERSTVQGAYTDGQAALGEGVYKSTCASCHELTFHTDDQFRMNWFGRTVYDLFKILKTTMPEDNIGGLSDDDYTRVIAYILKLNGFPAGADSLRADSLDMQRIRIGPATARADTAKKRRR